MTESGWRPGHFIKKSMGKLSGKDADSAAEGGAEAEAVSTSELRNGFVSEPAAAMGEGEGDDFADCSEHATSLSQRTQTFTAAAPFYLNVVVVDCSAAIAAKVCHYSPCSAYASALKTSPFPSHSPTELRLR
jgi:hypothetical protein